MNFKEFKNYIESLGLVKNGYSLDKPGKSRIYIGYSSLYNKHYFQYFAYNPESDSYEFQGTHCLKEIYKFFPRVFKLI